MAVESDPELWWKQEFETQIGGTFWVDLNALDGTVTAALVGLRGPQSVPKIGEAVTAVDENACAYDARVVAVLPDSRVYLDLNLASRRGGLVPQLGSVSYGWSATG